MALTLNHIWSVTAEGPRDGPMSWPNWQERGVSQPAHRYSG